LSARDSARVPVNELRNKRLPATACVTLKGPGMKVRVHEMNVKKQNQLPVPDMHISSAVLVENFWPSRANTVISK